MTADMTSPHWPDFYRGVLALLCEDRAYLVATGKTPYRVPLYDDAIAAAEVLCESQPVEYAPVPQRLGAGRRKTGVLDPKRASDMRQLYESGWTQEDIGTLFGVTRERVRQLIRAVGCDVFNRTNGRGRVDHLMIMAAARSSGSFAEAGRKLGLDASRVVEITKRLGTYESLRRLYRLRRRRTLLQPAALIAQLKDLAHRIGRTPSINDMNGDPQTATHMTFVRVFGTVRAAQVAAGLVPNAIGDRGHTDRRSRLSTP